MVAQPPQNRIEMAAAADIISGEEVHARKLLACK
jgi:hypothetical protein